MRLALLVVLLSGVALAAEALGAAPTVESLFHRGLAPVDLGATPLEDRVAGACVECHAGIAEEWAGSRHALSWTNGIFQREFQREPLAWCVRCHAPLAPGDADSVDALAAEGVSCAVCHLRDGRMLAARRAADSPHDTVVVDDFGGDRHCEGCHQFAFPVVEDGEVSRYTDHPMQHTVAEFRAGPHAEREGACLGCHGRTPAGHAFPGGHDPGAVRHAIRLDACAEGGRLRLGLSNVGAGHHLPTGDLHRHFRLRAWRSTAPESMFEAFVGRAFEPAEDAGKRVKVDTSIPPQESRSWTVDLADLGGAHDEAVSVELRYIYTADEEPTARADPGEPTYLIVHELRAAAASLPACEEG